MLTIFRAHDLDNNKKLDGLELFAALDHDLRHEAEITGEEHSPKDTEGNHMDNMD